MADALFNIAAYRSFLSQGKLMACRCTACRQIYLPPRPICPQCQSQNMQWTQLCGQGKLAAFTAITVACTTMAQQGYGRDKPYLTGYVALKEGPTVPARIEAESDDVQVGMALRADFVEESNGESKQVMLLFRPS